MRPTDKVNPNSSASASASVSTPSSSPANSNAHVPRLPSLSNGLFTTENDRKDTAAKDNKLTTVPASSASASVYLPKPPVQTHAAYSSTSGKSSTSALLTSTSATPAGPYGSAYLSPLPAAVASTSPSAKVHLMAAQAQKPLPMPPSPPSYSSVPKQTSAAYSGIPVPSSHPTFSASAPPPFVPKPKAPTPATYSPLQAPNSSMPVVKPSAVLKPSGQSPAVPRQTPTLGAYRSTTTSAPITAASTLLASMPTSVAQPPAALPSVLTPAVMALDAKKVLPVIDSTNNSQTFTTSLSTKKTEGPFKVSVIIDFDGLFRKNGLDNLPGFKAHEICAQLKLLLTKRTKIIFLTHNLQAAQKLLISTGFDYIKRVFLDSPDCDFVVCKPPAGKIEYIRQCISANSLRKSDNKEADKNNEKVERLTLVVISMFDGLGQKNDKTCHFMTINHRILKLSVGEQYIADLKALIDICATNKELLEKEEKQQNIDRLNREVDALRFDPKFMILERRREYLKGELDLVGDIAYILQIETERREIKDFFMPGLPSGIEVAPIYANKDIYESFARALAILKINIPCSVRNIKDRILEHLATLGDDPQNWVQSNFRAYYKNKGDRGPERYKEFIEMLKLSQREFAEKTESGECGFKTVARDQLNIDCRLICELYSVTIHVAKREETKQNLDEDLLREQLLAANGEDQQDAQEVKAAEYNLVHFIVDKTGARKLEKGFNSQKVDMHIIAFEKKDKMSRVDKCFMPALPADKVEASLDKPIDTIMYDPYLFTQKIMPFCNMRAVELITSSVIEFSHFLFSIYTLFEFDTNKVDPRAVEPTTRRDSNKGLISPMSAGNISPRVQVVESPIPGTALRDSKGLITSPSPRSSSSGTSILEQSQTGVRRDNRKSGDKTQLVSNRPNLKLKDPPAVAPAGKSSPRSQESSPVATAPIGRSSPRAVDLSTGRSSPRAVDLSTGRSSPLSENLLSRTSGNRSPRPEGSGIPGKRNTAESSKFNDFINDMAVIFNTWTEGSTQDSTFVNKDDVTNPTASAVVNSPGTATPTKVGRSYEQEITVVTNTDLQFRQFIYNFLIVMAITSVKRIRLITEQFNENCTVKKNFVTIENDKLVWSSTSNKALFHNEVHQFFLLMREEMLRWFEIIKNKIRNSNNDITYFLKYSFAILRQLQSSKNMEFNNVLFDYNVLAGPVQSKANERDQYVEESRTKRYTLALSGKINVGSTFFCDTVKDIFALCRERNLHLFIKELNAVLNRSTFNIDDPSKVNGTPEKNLLQIACGQGSTDIVSELIERSANVNFRRDFKTDAPPLFYIVKHLNFNPNLGKDIITLLLNAGAETVAFDPLGFTPLHVAEEGPTALLLDYLITMNPCRLTAVIFTVSAPIVSNANTQPCTPLCFALKNLKADIVNIYFSHGILLPSNELNALLRNNSNIALLKLLAASMNQNVERYNKIIHQCDSEIKVKESFKEKSSPQKIVSPRKSEIVLSPRIKAEIDANNSTVLIYEEGEWLKLFGLKKHEKPAPLTRTSTFSRLFALLPDSGKHGRTSSNPGQLEPSSPKERSGSLVLPSPRSGTGRSEPARNRSETVSENNSPRSQTATAQDPVKSPRFGSGSLPRPASLASPDIPRTGSSSMTIDISKDSSSQLIPPIPKLGVMKNNSSSQLITKGSGSTTTDLQTSPKQNASAAVVTTGEMGVDILNMLSGKTGLAPIHIVCITGNMELLDKLLDNQVNVSVCSEQGFTPYYYAALNGHLEILKKLRSHKARMIPIKEEIEQMHARELEKLTIDEGRILLMPTIMRATDRTPLHVAAERNDPALFEEVANYAIESKCYECFYRRDSESHTALLKVVLSINLKNLEFCRDKGIWLNQTNDISELTGIPDPVKRKDIFLSLLAVYNKPLMELNEKLKVLIASSSPTYKN